MVTDRSHLEKLVGRKLATTISEIASQAGIRSATHVFAAHDFDAHNLARYYIDIANQKSVAEADEALASINNRLHLREINLSCSLQELIQDAKRIASVAHRIFLRGKSPENTYLRISRLAKRYQLNPSKIEGQKTADTCAQRMICERWWRRNLKRAQKQLWEAVRRDIGLVNKHRSTYSSAFIQTRRMADKANTLDYLSKTYICNELGAEFSLKELHESSVSNPAVRRAELMTRISGFEEVADRLGHKAEFYTITAPSRMHARLAKSGKANPKYDGSDPLTTHQYLCQVWTCIRAKLGRKGLKPYGFRVVEPHHDGTPHWHLLLFMRPEDVRPVRSIIRSYAEREDSYEIRNKSSRFKHVAIDLSQGSAAGYIAKYISKNIDGAHLDKDLYGNAAKGAANAIEAWASCWGIRQFQQIGGPSVGIWRELRKLFRAESFDELSDDILVKQAALKAGASEWADFVILMGGPDLKRSIYPISTQREETNIFDRETGEIASPSFNQFGEPTQGKVIGLSFDDAIYKTRFHTWMLSNAPPPGSHGVPHEAPASVGIP